MRNAKTLRCFRLKHGPVRITEIQSQRALRSQVRDLNFCTLAKYIYIYLHILADKRQILPWRWMAWCRWHPNCCACSTVRIVCSVDPLLYRISVARCIVASHLHCRFYTTKWVHRTEWEFSRALDKSYRKSRQANIQQAYNTSSKSCGSRIPGQRMRGLYRVAWDRLKSRSVVYCRRKYSRKRQCLNE